MVTSLDRFINKMVIKRIFLIIQWSSLLENSIFGPVFEWLKQDGSITGRSGIWSFTVNIFLEFCYFTVPVLVLEIVRKEF
jgi:hypothetical protein